MKVILWHLWYVVFKDVQRGKIALGVGRQDHWELKDVLHRDIKKGPSKKSLGKQVPNGKKKCLKPWWAGLAATPPLSKAKRGLPHSHLASTWFPRWESIWIVFLFSWINPIKRRLSGGYMIWMCLQILQLRMAGSDQQNLRSYRWPHQSLKSYRWARFYEFPGKKRLIYNFLAKQIIFTNFGPKTLYLQIFGVKAHYFLVIDSKSVLSIANLLYR